MHAAVYIILRAWNCSIIAPQIPSWSSEINSFLHPQLPLPRDQNNPLICFLLLQFKLFQDATWKESRVMPSREADFFGLVGCVGDSSVLGLNPWFLLLHWTCDCERRGVEWVAFPSPGDLPIPGAAPRSPALQADSLPAETPGEPPGGASGRAHLPMRVRCKTLGFHSWVGKIPWRRAWPSTPVFLPGESHGRRSLGYSSQGRTESDTTEVT